MAQDNDACSPVLLTQSDVSARLQVSQRQIQRMVAAGDFPPPMKVGSQNRWSEAHLEAYISGIAERAGVGTRHGVE
ncbi:MAG: helix-turn-helix domain-containing protein [Pseudomonadota bacterium]